MAANTHSEPEPETKTDEAHEEPSQEQAIELARAEDADEIRAALPEDVRSELTKRAFSPGSMRKLLRDTYYAGPIGIGRGGWRGIYGGGQPGTEMRRPDGAFHGFPRSWRYASLDRALRLGLIAHVGGGKFAATERGVAVLNEIDICSECGETRVPKVAKSYYKRSPFAAAQTSTRLCTQCPDCGSNGYSGSGFNSGTTYVDYERSDDLCEHVAERIDGHEDARSFGVREDVSEDAAETTPDFEADELAEIDEVLDEHVESFVPPTPREVFTSATEDRDGRPVVTIPSEGDAYRFTGTEAAVVVSRCAPDRDADLRIVVDPEDDDRVRVEMSYNVAVKEGAKDRLNIDYEVVGRKWDGDAKQWSLKADGLSSVLGALSDPVWNNKEDSRAFEVVVESEAVARSDFPVLGVDEDGDLLSNDELNELRAENDEDEDDGADDGDADDDADDADADEEVMNTDNTTDETIDGEAPSEPADESSPEDDPSHSETRDIAAEAAAVAGEPPEEDTDPESDDEADLLMTDGGADVEGRKSEALRALQTRTKEADTDELKEMYGALLAAVRNRRAMDGDITMLLDVDDEGEIARHHYVPVNRGSYIPSDRSRKYDASISIGTGAFVSYEDVRRAAAYGLAQSIEGHEEREAREDSEARGGGDPNIMTDGGEVVERDEEKSDGDADADGGSQPQQEEPQWAQKARGEEFPLTEREYTYLARVLSAAELREYIGAIMLERGLREWGRDIDRASPSMTPRLQDTREILIDRDYTHPSERPQEARGETIDFPLLNYIMLCRALHSAEVRDYIGIVVLGYGVREWASAIGIKHQGISERVRAAEDFIEFLNE